jgi:phage gp29-like protein
MIDKCNAEISKAILSQTLTSEVTSGSKAAAETHLKIRNEVIENDIKFVEDAWNQLISKIYQVNFTSKNVPAFAIDKSEIESSKKLQRDKALVKDCGIKFNNNYWMRNYNIKEDELSKITV